MLKNKKLQVLCKATLVIALSNCWLNTVNAEAYSGAEASAAERKVSFWDLTALEPAYFSAKPKARNDGIEVGKLALGQKNKDDVFKLAYEIAAGKHGKYDSMLVSHKGELVFESYYQKGRIDLAHGQASAAKGLTSLVLGRAIQLGYLSMDDFNKPLINFLKDLDRAKLADGAEKITLHKALTMRGGIRIGEEQGIAIEQEPEKVQGQQHVQVLLEHTPAITAKSQEYSYGNFNPTLVMQVINAVVPGGAQKFIKRELLDKMGITNYKWNAAVSGLPAAGWRVSLTSRDMLKLGSLLNNKGKWQGQQLISVDYLTQATKGIVQPTEDWIPEQYLYGYFFYQTPVAVGDKTYDVNFAWGGGGQYIIAVAELDLTVVITGHDGQDKIMPQVLKTLVPAIVG